MSDAASEGGAVRHHCTVALHKLRFRVVCFAGGFHARQYSDLHVQLAWRSFGPRRAMVFKS